MADKNPKHMLKKKQVKAKDKKKHVYEYQIHEEGQLNIESEKIA